MLNTININPPPLVESQRVEFQRQLTDGLEKELVAFSHAHKQWQLFLTLYHF